MCNFWKRLSCQLFGHEPCPGWRSTRKHNRRQIGQVCGRCSEWLKDEGKPLRHAEFRGLLHQAVKLNGEMQETLKTGKIGPRMRAAGYVKV